MSKRRLTTKLKGGLGNQMFQYATGRALALRNNMVLVLDTTSGFIRDKVYRRSFSLDQFSIQAQRASFFAQIPFWFERGLQKFAPDRLVSITNRPWGSILYETELRFKVEIIKHNLQRNTWMEGYWQSEKYFCDYQDIIANEFTLNEEIAPNFVAMAQIIDSCNSVAVGVRVFEEVPGLDKSGVGGITPFSFYEENATRIANMIKDPIFFVLCTSLDAVKGRLSLPGPIQYLTKQNGFDDPVQTLWLLNHFRYHIISNSSFYWWGAWLAERHNPEAIIIASDLFCNHDSVPLRWKAK